MFQAGRIAQNRGIGGVKSGVKTRRRLYRRGCGVKFKVIEFDLPYRLIRGELRQFHPLDEPLVELVDDPDLGRIGGQFVRVEPTVRKMEVTHSE